MNATKCYKLTTQERTTGALLWTPGQWHTASAIGELCSPAFLHAYPSPLAAIFMNPVHARIHAPKLWVAEALGASKEDAGLKLGFAQLRVVNEILPPQVDQEHRIRLALKASLVVCTNPAWREYADNYLNGPEIKFRQPDKYFKETGVEIHCRTYAYKASQYEEVEFNSALALQIAVQASGTDAEALFQEAYGKKYVEVDAKGRSTETAALRTLLN